VPIATLLENMADELDDWHPGIVRHMNSTNDLDIVLRNTMHSDFPSGIDHMAIRHGRLVERLVDDGDNEMRSSH
jgi:hypothetical protein